MALSLLPSRLSQLDAGEESAAGRVDAWYQGLQMFVNQPIFGVGKGNFTEHNHLTAHNSLVLVFAEIGAVGYFVWLAFVGLSVYMVYKISVTKAEHLGEAQGGDAEEWTQYKKISRTYFYAMLGFFVAAFFLSRSYSILLVILCGLCVATYQSARQRWPRLALISFWKIAGVTLAFEIGSIGFMYILVKLLTWLGK